ncbi:MAG TPA: primosomal protein N', partial [Gaiellaceae bacterium]|nr:primosomal protein N' [Gaiellaceae bacterium]
RRLQRSLSGGLFQPAAGLRSPPVSRFATVYPLVSARAVARPFTYEAPDDVRKGAVVEVRFGRARTRGVVTEVDVPPPDGIAPSAIERILETLPPVLVDLALWLAAYYGSTPARALALVAPARRARRGERREVAAAAALAAEPAPDRLSEPQRLALARVEELLARGGGHVLLSGATGSGKTEVYLRACEAAVAAGRGAIVLVPEIALTPQTLGRFRARFGERVAVLHSGLSDAERRDERERIAAGEAPVVVGARSAVFAPLPALGVVCVDEEHDASYKHDSDPRYDARTVSAKRASLEQAVAIFGSATPRPESWHALERLELGGRLATPLPPVGVVDLRREAGYPLSAPLLAELGRLAEGGGKAILLLNRRGVAPALHCRACGATRRCERCDVALTLHGDGMLRCHHCDARQPAGETCPVCGSTQLARIGAGTQRLERELERHVPELERIRLDADAVAGPGRLREALERFARSERAVLVGTQMVAKGHHFPGVELAAVVDADTGLALPDFRAEERTFQLLTQLAGRSGRDAPGRVLVQTFQPESRAVQYAARHDVAGFLGEELERRRALGYPPFRHLVRILVTGPELASALRALEELKAGLPGFELLGPAPLLRLRGRQRAQLVGKTDRPRALAVRAAALLAAAAPAMRRAGLTAVVDVDPQSL